MALKVLGKLIVKGILKVGTYFIPTPTGESRLYLWGYNISAQLGDNTLTNRSSPVQTVAYGTDWYKLGQGQLNNAGIKADGTLWLWGGNATGLLGDNTTTNRSSPVQTITGGTNWIDYSIGGGSHILAVKNDGTLWTWGFNNYGQLGDNTTTNKSSPVQVLGYTNNWKQPSSGSFHSAAIKNDGTLWTWGDNTFGQLGDNSTNSQSSPVQTVTGGTNWKQVSCGNNHTTAIKTDGTLWTWGINSNAVLGNNSTIPKSSPIQTIAYGTNWSQVSAGNTNTAAIKTDGTLWVWGDNYYGTIGDNTTTNKSSPVQTITGGTNWLKVSTADSICGALKTDGTLWLWGRNYFGEIGDNTTIKRSSPVQTINAGTGWKDIAAGGGYTFAGIFQPTATTTTPAPSGYLYMWGSNSFARLGDNTTISRSSPVQTVAGGNDWADLSSGQITTMAKKTDGTLWLWGANYHGQLGDNTIINKSSPIQTIANGNNWQTFSAGSTHVAAIKTDGTLWVWGRNYNGQLGTNDTANYSSPVQTIAGGNNWQQVSCGYEATAAIKTDGTLWLWGYNNYGQLGNNSINSQSSPIQILGGGINWKQVSQSGYYTLAVKTNGTLWTWGTNINGCLGDNTTVSKSSPVQTIAYGTNWNQVSGSGNYFTAATKTDGTLWCWGTNYVGEIGDNTTIDRSSPVQTISYGTNWLEVYCGTSSVHAIKTDGSVWNWGGNSNGDLGDNTNTNRSSPVQTIMNGTWIKINSNTGGGGAGGIKS